MGWDFIPGWSRDKLVTYLLGPSSGADVIAHHDTGEVLWVVLEHRLTNDRVLGCYLIEKDEAPLSEKSQRALKCESPAVWGYKWIEENQGPYYYDCPLEFFAKAGEPMTKPAKNWRGAVERYWEKILHKPA
jgi:hypothetical protein